ncbi:MAG: SRPBCC family protein [Anaerolineales bacterium]|jgi:ligand-binding SRPBCC domain-containing protein
MKIYKHEFRVTAPVAEVAEFHGDTRALKLLTPPPLVVKFHEVESLAEGSLSDFTFWLGPIPVRWKAIHKDVDLNSGFKDIQLEGPFKFWEHTHTFLESESDRTIVRDEIKAEFSNHPYRRLVCRMMWANLPGLFAYRKSRTKLALEP